MEPITIKVIWIELPVADIHRALTFYERVFATSLELMELGDLRMATFAHAGAGVSLNYHPQFYFPGEQGPVVYFSPAGDPLAMQERIKKNGGEILIPWREISPDQGSMGLFQDSEGNRIGIRSLEARQDRS